jgi:SH3 domain.
MKFSYNSFCQAITTLSGLDIALDDEDEEPYHVPRSIYVPRHETEDSDSIDELMQLFVTIFPFDPTESNELKLEVGDLIDVLKTSETGWWKGCCLRTQDDGWFPSSYAKVEKQIL